MSTKIKKSAGQLRLFDREGARAARDEAISRVAESHEAWISAALKAVRAIARSRQTFTTDDLWKHVAAPEEPRAAGPLMLAAMKLGICVPTTQTSQSARKRCHARPLRVWRSLVWRGT